MTEEGFLTPTPMLSERQAALFAAVNSAPKADLDGILSLADRYLAWLNGEERVRLAEAGTTARAKPMLESALDRLNKALENQFPDDQAARFDWLNKWLAARGIAPHIDQLSIAVVRAAITDLEMRRKARA